MLYTLLDVIRKQIVSLTYITLSYYSWFQTNVYYVYEKITNPQEHYLVKCFTSEYKGKPLYTMEVHKPFTAKTKTFRSSINNFSAWNTTSDDTQSTLEKMYAYSPDMYCAILTYNVMIQSTTQGITNEKDTMEALEYIESFLYPNTSLIINKEFTETMLNELCAKTNTNGLLQDYEYDITLLDSELRPFYKTMSIKNNDSCSSFREVEHISIINIDSEGIMSHSSEEIDLNESSL